MSMTPEEVTARIDDAMMKRGILEKRIVMAARAVIPVLLDAQRTNSASELKELFFEMDALDQELHSIVSGNLGAALAAITNKLKRGAP